MKSATFTYQAGRVPVLMSMPHLGTGMAPAMVGAMTEHGLQMPDTDWDLDRLYDFAAQLGLHIIAPRYSRYVIDLNRAPDGQALYPGARNTELVPTTTFHEQPIYQPGRLPGEADIAARRDTYWRPYHARIASVLAELRTRHQCVVLFDCHSIRSEVTRFFDGRLADFNLGTAAGASCSPALRAALSQTLARHDAYTMAVDGRFKGGYITRHYSDPANGVHTFQMELSQATYADPEAPYVYSESLASRVRPALRSMLETVLEVIDDAD